jgi:transcriptional regulator with XRE-family HTH domain
MKKLGLQLQTHRLKLNLTQRQLSEKAGVPYSTLRKFESTGTGSMAHFVKMLKALEMLPQLAALGLSEVGLSESSNPRRRVRRRIVVTSASTDNLPIPSHGLKSERLGLSFAYDWSNPQIDDAVLIAKVLDKARFDDVSRTIAHFGLALVEQVAHEFGISLNMGPLGAILPSIRIAQSTQSRPVI